MTESSATRRELGELKVLYKLKPHFRDVIVEGRDDAAWLRWFLRECGAKDVRVYAVDDRVTVPRELVTEVHEDVNPRGRVVAVAASFEDWDSVEPSLTCIVDYDFELFEPAPNYDSLLKTDFAAMEVYALAERPLSKFLVSSAKSDVAAVELVSLLKPAWAVLYALRYVLHRHSDGLRLAERFADRCINDAGEVIADAQELLRTAMPTPTRDVLQELLRMHTRYLEMVPLDSLQGIRGHDAAPLLVRFLKLKNELAKPDSVERLLRQSIELRDLEGFQLFERLKARMHS